MTAFNRYCGGKIYYSCELNFHSSLPWKPSCKFNDGHGTLGDISEGAFLHRQSSRHYDKKAAHLGRLVCLPAFKIYTF